MLIHVVVSMYIEAVLHTIQELQPDYTPQAREALFLTKPSYLDQPHNVGPVVLLNTLYIDPLIAVVLRGRCVSTFRYQHSLACTLNTK